MEYTEDEILEVVQRWENSGLLYGLPLHEKQELAPLYDNVTRILLYKFETGEVPRGLSDLMDGVIYPVCRRLYRRVGSEFEVDKMINTLIKRVIENQKILLQPITDNKVNPIVEFCVEFADIYEDEVIAKKQFNDEEYDGRVNKIIDSLREILLNKDMVSQVDRSETEWKVMLSEAKKSPKQTRINNQKVGLEFLRYVLSDTNKGI